MSQFQIPATALGGMQRARSVDEYVDLVRQARDECADLRAAIEYDLEAMGGATAFLEPLEAGLQHLYESFQAGNYVFANGDLPFMRVVAHADERLLGFRALLMRINETHLKGLACDESDRGD